jgi:hypothetical protein
MIVIEVFLDLLFLGVAIDDDSQFVVLGGEGGTEVLLGRTMKRLFRMNSACYIAIGLLL